MEIEQKIEKDRYFSIYKSFNSKSIKGGFPITYITKDKTRKKGIITYSNYSIQLWKNIEQKKMEKNKEKLIWSFENLNKKIITIKPLFKQENVTNSNVILILNLDMNLEIYSIFEEKCIKITNVNTDIDTKKKNYENITKLEINKKGTICVISDFDKEFWVINLAHNKKNLKIKKVYNFYFFKKILDFFFIEDTLAILEEFNYEQGLSFLDFEIENETFEVSKNLGILEFSELSKNENLKNMNIKNVFDIIINEYIFYFLVEGGFFFYDIKNNELKGFLEIDVIDGKIFKENYFDNIIYFFIRNSDSEKLKVLEINLNNNLEDFINITENVNINFKGEINFCNKLVKLEGFKFLALTDRRNTYYYDFTFSRTNNTNFEELEKDTYFKKRVFYKNMKIDQIVEYNENSIFFDKYYGKLDFVCKGVKTIFESFENEIFEETKNFEVFFENNKIFLILNLFRGFSIMELSNDYKKGDIIFIYRQDEKVLDIFFFENKIFLICEKNILGFDLKKNYEKKIYKNFENNFIIKVEKNKNNLFLLDNKDNIIILKYENENFENIFLKKFNSNIHLLKIRDSKIYIHNYFETKIFISDEKFENIKEIQISNKNLNDLEILNTEEDNFLFLGFRDGRLEIKNSKYENIFNFTINSFPLNFFKISIEKKNEILILAKKVKIFDIKTKKQKLIDLEYIKKIVNIGDSNIIALQKNLISFHKFEKNKQKNEELIKTPILENLYKIKKIFIKEKHLLCLFKKKDDENLYVNIFDLELNKKIAEKFIGNYYGLDILGFSFKTENFIIFSICNKNQDTFFYSITRYFSKTGKIEDFNLIRFSTKIEKMYYCENHNFIIFENSENLIINNIVVSRSRRLKKVGQKTSLELKKNNQIDAMTKKGNILLKNDILAFITIFNEIQFFSYEKKFQKFINRATHLDKEEIFYIDMIDYNKFIISTLKTIKIIKFNNNQNPENYYQMELIGKIDFFIPFSYINFEKDFFVSENDDIFKFFEIGNEEFNFFKLLEKIINEKNDKKGIYFKGRNFVKMLNLKEKLKNNRIDFDKVFENDFVIENKKMNFKMINIEFKKNQNIYELIECFKKENLYKKWFPESIVKKCERILFNE